MAQAEVKIPLSLFIDIYQDYAGLNDNPPREFIAAQIAPRFWRMMARNRYQRMLESTDPVEKATLLTQYQEAKERGFEPLKGLDAEVKIPVPLLLELASVYCHLGTPHMTRDEILAELEPKFWRIASHQAYSAMQKETNPAARKELQKQYEQARRQGRSKQHGNV